MSNWTQVAYAYDGSFSGFLTCVFESYVHKEAPACFMTPEDPRLSLWPERQITADEAKAKRVYQSLRRKISVDAQVLVTHGFLTCLEERELHLWRFLELGYRRGGQVMRDLTDSRVDILRKAAWHAEHEAHMYKGFVRFSEQEGVLIAEMEPKNRVLPLLRPHFCARFSGERFIIYDRTHKEALFHQGQRWAIVPLAEFQVSAPGARELDFRRLWRRFYETIAIEGRENPRLRMSNMPKRYWNTMTEFQGEEGQAALP